MANINVTIEALDSESLDGATMVRAVITGDSETVMELIDAGISAFDDPKINSATGTRADGSEVSLPV